MAVWDAFLSRGRKPVFKIFSAVRETFAGKTAKEAEVAIKRVDSAELERMYYLDPIIFTGVNLYQHAVLSGFEIVAKDEKIKSFFDVFRDQVGVDVLMAQIVQHIGIYGNAWLEKIYSAGRTDLVDLDIVDPKTMDFQRDRNQRVKLDERGKIVGYIQILKGVAPEGSVVESDEAGRRGILFDPEDIAHFKLFSIADSFLGVGLIEPLYKTVQIKMNVQEGVGQSMYRHGFPQYVVYCGDEKHHPTPEDMAAMAEQVRDVNYLTELVLPFYNKIELIEPKNIEKLKEHMDYYREEEVAGLGIPMAILLGVGEKTNRATLIQQSIYWDRKIKTIQSLLSFTFEKKIFKDICDLKGFKEVPRIVWNELSIQDLSAKAERLAAYADKGLLTPDADTESLIRKLESLPQKK